ncbi:hypothetical protein BDZ45DRAFT_392107 [Acephala macrosclerotiorum]|nr:hypothetical protein BDZ45DRAFT_392107 [Acephala macrosclerotiorum]
MAVILQTTFLPFLQATTPGPSMPLRHQHRCRRAIDVMFRIYRRIISIRTCVPDSSWCIPLCIRDILSLKNSQGGLANQW